MARIITVYNTERDALTRPRDMAHIRWLKISEALARQGHVVDMASAELRLRVTGTPVPMGANLRRVPLTRVRWEDYDVVKTLFHQGFETLTRLGGDAHPFIVAKLGSVVAPEDREGIYFYGPARDHMFAVQRAIHHRARYITLLSPPARTLWEETIGTHSGFLLVPGAVDDEIPPPGRDPYPAHDGLRVVFSGNLYDVQDEATRVLSSKLNALGALLAPHGRLYVVGPGDTSRLDRRVVTHLGSVAYRDSWDYLHHAHVGIVVSAGAFMHNNESTKIYHYLRAGLPMVSEAGFPNDHVVHESGLGVVAPNGDMPAMAAAIVQASRHPWDRDGAVRYIRQHHTWDVRAATYRQMLARHFPA